MGSISTACIGIKSLQDTTLRFPKLRDLQRTKSPYSRFDCILRYFCLMPSVPRHLKRFFANANHNSCAPATSHKNGHIVVAKDILRKKEGKRARKNETRREIENWLKKFNEKQIRALRDE